MPASGWTALQPPAHIAQGIVGAGHEGRQAIAQANAARLQCGQRHRVVHRRGLRLEEALRLLQLDGIDQQHAVHQRRPQGRVGIVVDEGIAGGHQPAQVELLAQKFLLGQPQRLEAGEVARHVEFTPYQHHEAGVVVEQFGAADEFPPQALQMGLQVGQRAIGVFGILARNQGLLEGLQVGPEQLARRSTRAEAPPVAVEGEPFFNACLAAAGHGEGSAGR